MATEDARYRSSTQFRLWSFSPDSLTKLRASTNSHAVSTIAPRLPLAADTGPPPPLTPNEELHLLRFYTCELLRAAAFCGLPTEVRATAAIFMRRFYTTNSVMTYPPTEILKTCLFFAAKAEGQFGVDLDHFASNFPKTTPEMVLAGEYLLCQGIRFAFDVRHPFRALEGAIIELKRLEPEQISRVETAHLGAREILKFSPLVTDAYFFYTPSQIMLAALASVDEGLADMMIERAFASGAPEPSSSACSDENRTKVLETLAECRRMLDQEPPQRFTEYWGTPTASNEFKALVRKLRKCRDPDRANLVALQAARREQVTTKPKPHKRDADDIFGGPM